MPRQAYLESEPLVLQSENARDNFVVLLHQTLLAALPRIPLERAADAMLELDNSVWKDDLIQRVNNPWRGVYAETPEDEAKREAAVKALDSLFEAGFDLRVFGRALRRGAQPRVHTRLPALSEMDIPGEVPAVLWAVKTEDDMIETDDMTVSCTFLAEIFRTAERKYPKPTKQQRYRMRGVGMSRISLGSGMKQAHVTAVQVTSSGVDTFHIGDLDVALTRAPRELSCNHWFRANFQESLQALAGVNGWVLQEGPNTPPYEPKTYTFRPTSMGSALALHELSAPDLLSRVAKMEVHRRSLTNAHRNDIERDVSSLAPHSQLQWTV